MGNHVSAYINHLTEGDETTHTNTGAIEKARVVSKGQVDYLLMWLYPSAVITSTDSFFFFSKRHLIMFLSAQSHQTGTPMFKIFKKALFYT